MSFHKAADAPSNSINSLAPIEWHFGLACTKMTSGNMDLKKKEIPVMFSLIPDSHRRPLPATHILHITGVMD